MTRLVRGDEVVSDAELDAMTEHGDADFYAFQADLVVRYAFHASAEVFLSLPYKLAALRPEHEDEHHRREILQGLADLRLGSKVYPIAGKAFLLGVSLGVSMPTGRRSAITRLSFVDHHQAEELGVTVPVHSHLQLGTGTFDPFAGIEALVRFDDRWALFGALEATVPVYANGDGYRTAPSGGVTLGPAFSLAGPRLQFGLFAEATLAGRDRLSAEDVVGTSKTLDGDLDVPNTGRFELALSPSVTWWATDAFSLALRARIPLYTRIDERPGSPDLQVTEPVGVFLGFAYDFQVGRSEVVHDHEKSP